MDTILSSTSRSSLLVIRSYDALLLLCAIKNNKLNQVRNLLLKNKTLVNIPITTMSRPLHGYTALHMACLENNFKMVHMLIKEFNADVNVKTTDGTQPLIIAGLRGHLNIVKILIEANANVEAEFGKDIQTKYAQDLAWCDNLDDKITLALFAIMNDKIYLLRSLIKNSYPFLDWTSDLNKNLLMYTIERDNDKIAEISDAFYRIQLSRRI